MQQRDQSRAAFINEAEFRLDPGADLACRTRKRSAYPRLQIVFLLGGHIACAPAHIEAGQAFDPALLEEPAPAAHGVVVEQKPFGDLLTAPPGVKNTKAFARRVTRQGEDASRAKAISALRSSSLRKPD